MPCSHGLLLGLLLASSPGWVGGSRLWAESWAGPRVREHSLEGDIPGKGTAQKVPAEAQRGQGSFFFFGLWREMKVRWELKRSRRESIFSPWTCWVLRSRPGPFSARSRPSPQRCPSALEGRDTVLEQRKPWMEGKNLDTTRPTAAGKAAHLK